MRRGRLLFEAPRNRGAARSPPISMRTDRNARDRRRAFLSAYVTVRRSRTGDLQQTDVVQATRLPFDPGSLLPVLEHRRQSSYVEGPWSPTLHRFQNASTLTPTVNRRTLFARGYAGSFSLERGLSFELWLLQPEHHLFLSSTTFVPNTTKATLSGRLRIELLCG
jgi:hypothetical protein